MKPGYAAVGITVPGTNKIIPMSANGKIVLFDTPNMARHFLPQLGGGRLCHWDVTEEIISFSPVDPNGVNLACILTGYDPYNLPPGMPVPSEAHSLEWRNHIMWFDILMDKGQFQERSDGSMANLAIGEQA